MIERRPYRRGSWLDPRLEVRLSRIGGRGTFARAPIRQGQVVTVWGGTVFTEAEVRAGKHKPHTLAGIDEGLYLGVLPDEPDGADQFLNHSCDPNLWMTDEVTLAARRDIADDEELTADYAMWETDSNWVMPASCRCGSALCRGTITGNDWRLRELQERYRGHFSPCVNERIRQLRRTRSGAE